MLEYSEQIIRLKKELRDVKLRERSLLEEIKANEAARAARMGLRAPSSGDGRQPTVWEMAQIVLRAVKDHAPQHTKDIHQEIEERFKVVVDPGSLSNILRNKSKDHKVFFKDRKSENTYGLLEWERER